FGLTTLFSFGDGAIKSRRLRNERSRTCRGHDWWAAPTGPPLLFGLGRGWKARPDPSLLEPLALWKQSRPVKQPNWPSGAVQRAISYKYPGQALSRGPAGTTTGPGRSPACDRQAAGWLKVATSRPNASMWSLIEKPTTAPRVVAGRPRLGTSSANTDNR